MKLPRNLSARELVTALARLGYAVDHQTGSHIRLATARGGAHHLTVPARDPLKVGTLAAILRSVGDHHDMTRDETLRALFD